jgi:hypothetical protein
VAPAGTSAPPAGVPLRFEPPNGHVCPSDNRRLAGWPYDQVIYANRHDALANAARDLALAYRLTGNTTYAEKAAWILNAYAERYPASPSTTATTATPAPAPASTPKPSTKPSGSSPSPGPSISSRVPGVSSPDQSARIERHLLREAAATILRHDAGISNWQSWHNAALAAVAVTLNDSPLLSQALDGPRAIRSCSAWFSSCCSTDRQKRGRDQFAARRSPRTSRRRTGYRLCLVLVRAAETSSSTSTASFLTTAAT